MDQYQSESLQDDSLVALSNYKENSQIVEETVQNVPKRELGKSYYSLAKIYYDKADLNQAEKYFNLAIKHTELPQDYFSKFKILGFLIRIASEKLDTDKAETYIVHSEKLMNDVSKHIPTLTSEYFYNQGIVSKYRSNFQEAKENFLLALKKSKEENEPNVLAKCLYALAQCAYNEEQFQAALGYLNQLNDLLEILQKTYMMGTMNLLFGNVYVGIEDYDQADKYFYKASTSLKQKLCWNLQGYVFLGQGILAKKMGEFNRATWFFNQALYTVDTNVFMRLERLLKAEVADLNDSNVDLYLDRTNRIVYEKQLGAIDFKHRFVLLEILFLLAQNSGSYYDKEELAKRIWKDEYNPLIHDKLIYTSISRLRKLIEPKGEKRKYILRGKDGYTFNPLVKARFHKESRSNNIGSIGNVEISSPV